MTDAAAGINLEEDEEKKKEAQQDLPAEDREIEGLEDSQPRVADPSKTRTVSFNRDVHVKRIGPARGAAAGGGPLGEGVRRQPLAGLSRHQLAEEAARVLHQAASTACRSSAPPDRFFSLPSRKKQRPYLQNLDPTHQQLARRRSEDLGVKNNENNQKPLKTSLTRSTSDVTQAKKLKKQQKNTLLNLFKRPDRELSYSSQNNYSELSAKKPGRSIVKRSKSDVSDLKSDDRPLRKRTGSESEEYLNSVLGKKSQLSPIIEGAQDDFFKSKSLQSIDKVCEELPKIVVTLPTPVVEYKVNPIEKPPRTKDPKPPTRVKRAKTQTGKDESFKQGRDSVKAYETLPRTKQHKKLLVDEIDEFRIKDHKDIKKNIKDTISLLEQKEDKDPEMIHSSQKPPEKLPLTKGQTVDSMVKFLNKDKFSPPPRATLLMPANVAARNNNQPFSYTKPSVSPDPNLYARSPSPDKPPSPINKSARDADGQGIIYAQVVCGNGDSGRPAGAKQTVHTTVAPNRHTNNQHSDEDEGFGYEESRMHASSSRYNDQTDYSYSGQKIGDDPYRHLEDYPSEKDSPITPRIKDYRPHKFVGKELSYGEEYPEEAPDNHYVNYEDQRGRGDGMDARRRESLAEPDDAGYDKKKAELSYRRDLMESRINARKLRDSNSPGNRYTPEKEYIEDANPKEATEKYVAETSTRYYRDSDNITSGYTEKYTAETKVNKDGTLKKSEHRAKAKYNPDTALFEAVPDDEINRREFIDRRLAEEPHHLKYFSQKPSRYFPPEPEYEPPSLDSQTSGAKYSPEVRKFKPKNQRNSSHEALESTSRYSKHKSEKFANSKDHYASNPEIAQRVDHNNPTEQYNPDKPETFHNSLRRQKQNKSDKHYTNRRDYLEQSSSRSLRQQDSDGRRDLGYGGDTSGPESSRSRYDNDRDNKLADSGIENDYRKDSNGDIHRPKRVVSPNLSNPKAHHGRRVDDARNESEDEGFASSLLIASERQHTEDNHEVVHRRGRSGRNEEFIHRERSIDDGSFYDPRLDKFEERTSTLNRVHSKPPKSTKIISSLEKVKQLFSRDSSKKSKKDKEKRKLEEERELEREMEIKRAMVREEVLRRRYTEYRGGASGDEVSQQDVDYSRRHRLATPSPSPSPPRRPPGPPTHRKGPAPAPPPPSSWFSSMGRKNKNSKTEKESVLTTTEEESNISPKRYPSSGKPPTKNLRFFGDTDLESNDSVSKQQSTLRKRSQLLQVPRNENSQRTLTRTNKNLSSSVHALDRSTKPDKYKSSSLSNLQNGLHSFEQNDDLAESSLGGFSHHSSNRRRNLHNISEIHSNSETESIVEERQRRHDSVLKERNYDDGVRKVSSRNDNGTLKKPPMSPYKEKKRSRSYSNSKSTASKGSYLKNGYEGSKPDLADGDDLRVSSSEVHRSKQDLRGSRQELSNSRNELRMRRLRVPPAASPADSSTEGDSSHQSQRSVVYLHAATVGDIPGRSRIPRGRSRDDVSSVNSSRIQPQTRTVSRSFSVLAPWKPRHYREGYDINYSQTNQPKTLEKPPRQQPQKKESTFSFGKSKSSSTKNLASSKYDVRSNEDRATNKRLSSSSSTMPRRPNTHSVSSSNINSTLRKSDKNYRSNQDDGKENYARSRTDLSRDRKEYKKSMSTEVLSRESPPKGTKRTSLERERLARSISMPKDPNKSAGWFKITKKSKKTENTNRL